MTYRNYFRDHPEENLGYCKPFVNFSVVNDGEETVTEQVETGCSKCPFFDQCAAMDEVYGEE